MTDNILSVWMILNNLDVVVPTISLVRNCGIDSSGISFSDASARLRKLHHEQVISKNVDFEFKGSGFEYYYDNIQIYKKNDYDQISFYQLMIVIIKTFVKILTGK